MPKKADKEEKTEKEEKKGVQITDLPGVGPAIAAKLEEAGYLDLMSIAVLTPGELADVAGLTEATARKAINASKLL